MPDAAAQLILYFPLFGAAFDSDIVGELARGVAVCVPTAEEWRTLRKTDVWTVQPVGEAADADSNDAGSTPPCCIVANTALPEGPHHPNAIAAYGKMLL